MKKLLLLAALITAAGAYSRTLTPEEAIQRLHADDSGRSLAPAAAHPKLMKTVKSENGNAAVYMFTTESDCWMAVSANDAAAPLLGYGSNPCHADQLPPQMEWWLGEYSRRIQWADSIAASSNDRIMPLTASEGMKSPKKGDLFEIEPLLSTTWDQNYPYNLYTPEIYGKNAPTGCVATALAQVMKYHEYPEAGHGLGTVTTSTGDTFTMDLDMPLAWDKMRDYYWAGDDIFDADIDAVARLMQVVGYASGMSYSLNQSSTNDIYAARAVVDNFDYAASTWLYYRDYYTTEDWEEMLHRQLADVGPMLYSGKTPSGGAHAFVCDGYSGNGYFHMNWGWGGRFDGYFLIDALEPDGVGTGGYEGGYNSNQTAIFGMQAPDINLTQPAPQLSQPKKFTTGIVNGSPSFDGAWYNLSYKNITFNLGVELTDTETNESMVYPQYNAVTITSNNGVGPFNTTLSRYDIPDGSYRIRIVSCTGDYPEWLPVLAPIGVKNYGKFSKVNGKWESDDDRPLEIIEASAPDHVYAYQPSTYSITLKNVNDITTSVEYGIYLVMQTDTGRAIVGKTDTSKKFIVAPNSTESFEQPFTFTIFGTKFEYDTPYNLMLADPNTLRALYDFGTVTVSEPILAQEVFLTPSFWSGVEGDSIQLNVTFIPEDTSWKETTWTSSDPWVAGVDSNGLVKIHHAGTCTITATTVDGSDRAARCEVTATSSVETLIDGQLPIDVYGADGKTILRQASTDKVSSLPAGFYILRQGAATKTVIRPL